MLKGVTHEKTVVVIVRDWQEITHLKMPHFSIPLETHIIQWGQSWMYGLPKLVDTEERYSLVSGVKITPPIA